MSRTSTDLYHSFPVHGDAVVRVLGQLVQSHSCALVNSSVFCLEVAHKRGHSPSITEGCPVAAPHAAVTNGLSQVATEPVVSL